MFFQRIPSEMNASDVRHQGGPVWNITGSHMIIEVKTPSPKFH